MLVFKPKVRFSFSLMYVQYNIAFQAILESSIWQSNFPKDITNISYEDYYGSRFNRFVRFHLCNLSSPKKKKIAFHAIDILT